MKAIDGRVITNPENAQSFSHAEIKQAADGMNPDALGDAFDAWAAISAAVTKAGEQFETAISKAVEQHWEGVAAVAAVAGIREYVSRVSELGVALDQQSEPLSAAAGAAATFRAAVPEVVPTSTNPRAAELRNSQEEQARDDMVTYYVEPYGSTAPGIPTLPPPVQPVGVPVSTIVGTIPVPTTGTEVGEVVSPNGDSPVTENPEETGTTGESEQPGTTEEQSSTEGQRTTEPEEVAPRAVTPSSLTSTNPADATAAASTTAAAPTTPGLPQSTPSPQSGLVSAALNGAPSRLDLPGGNVPGPAQVVGSTPAPGSPSPGSSQPPGSSQSPGSSQAPGTTQTPSKTPSPGASVAAVPAAAGAAAGAAGRPGAAGAPGHSNQLPPRVRGRRERDGEHHSPGYLRNEEHGKELVGETEHTVPPVLGAD